MHPLDRAAGAIAEAIAAVYRDIDDLRSTVPELVAGSLQERGSEVETGA